MELDRCRVAFQNEEKRRQTVEEIWKFAPKLFAILVGLRPGRFGKYITEFLKAAITDADLPFVRSDNTTKSVPFKLCSKRTPRHPIECMTTWDQARVNDFGRDQWIMLAPVFVYNDKIEHYELDDNCVLPWIEDDERTGAVEGGYGSVWKIAIHPSHQRIDGTMDQKVERVARS